MRKANLGRVDVSALGYQSMMNQKQNYQLSLTEAADKL
jgi:hypothetical protein